MEYSSSPPSSSGTLSPPIIVSPKHQAHSHSQPLPHTLNPPRHLPPAENHCHFSQVAPQGVTDDSAVLLQRPVNPAVLVQPPIHYTSPNVKDFNGTPSFVYPSTRMLMNQHVIQPMWH